MKDLGWIDAMLVAAGLGTGALSSEVAYRSKKRRPEGGVEFGGLISALSSVAALALGKREIFEFGAGVGLGVAVNDLSHQLSKGKRFDTVQFVGEKRVTDKWQGLVEIDPRMPNAEKEAIILPLLRDISAQSSRVCERLLIPEYALPADVVDMQLKACEALSQALDIKPGDPREMVKVQRWFHTEGVKKGGYEAAEHMTHPNPELRRADVDRFRLLSKLLERWDRTGELRFDCDDATIAVCSMAWYNGLRPYMGVISQNPMKLLHHIFPVIDMGGGDLYCLECIKTYPPFHVYEGRKIFAPLTRFCLVNPDGSFGDILV